MPDDPVLLSVDWPTAGNLPYFANLKVMRVVLRATRDALEATGGVVGAYLFFEDRFRFLARGPEPSMSEALRRGRKRAAEEFRASDEKELWGPAEQRVLRAEEQDPHVEGLASAPVAAGLAPEPGDYPWCGGPWLSAGD